MSKGQEPNWAWLGLLKWSLAHIDGTVPSEESPNFRQMSEEDKKFLEEVMKNGIIDEGERMKTILSNLVDNLESMKERKLAPFDDKESEESLTLLDELQDIVEQIDFAKSFSSMGGIQFLMGCASEHEYVPLPIRSSCLGVIATLCQNNPPVQLSMLEQGNIPKLLDLFFSKFMLCDETSANEEDEDLKDGFRGKVIQALSCSVRNHHIAEKIFCMNLEGKRAIESGLGIHRQRVPTLNLRRRTLFFLQALITSDSADGDRVRLFSTCIPQVVMFCDPEKEENLEIREMALSMLNRILNQKKSVNAILECKELLVKLGVRRVTDLRAVKEKKNEYIGEELELWESLVVELARACKDVATSEEAAQQPLSVKDTLEK